ncbi:MAG: CPBP family intramembrane glutamic endopeptidase [Polyangia bacterium]
MRPERDRASMLAIACVVAWAVAAFAARWVGQWAALGGIAVVLASVCLLTGRSTRSLWPATRRAWLVGLGAGLVGGVLMTLATYGLYDPVVKLAPMFFHDVTHLYGVFAKLPAWVATLILVPVIFSEELVWRGVVQTTLGKSLSAPTAAGVAALLYAAAHAPAGSPVLLLAALGCGIVWSALRGLTGGLVAPIVAHLVWDFSVLLVHPLAPPVLPS